MYNLQKYTNKINTIKLKHKNKFLLYNKLYKKQFPSPISLYENIKNVYVRCLSTAKNKGNLQE